MQPITTTGPTSSEDTEHSLGYRLMAIAKVAICSLGILLPGMSFGAEVTLAPTDSRVFKDVSHVAQQWSTALLNKDFEGLAVLTLPEYQEGVRKGLSNRDSALYKALYRRKDSPYQKLKNLKRVGIAVFGHDDLRQVGQGTTACFYDASNPPAAWPKNSNALSKLEKRSDVYCIFLAKVDSSWTVSTDFVER